MQLVWYALRRSSDLGRSMSSTGPVGKAVTTQGSVTGSTRQPAWPSVCTRSGLGFSQAATPAEMTRCPRQMARCQCPARGRWSYQRT